MCKVEGCNKVAVRKDGHCDWHYRKFRKAQTCSISGCKGVVRGRGWCGKHWQRWRTHGSPEIRLRAERSYGDSRINSNGYVIEFVPGHIEANEDGKCMQHRRVVSDFLGRRLEKFENVHHKNGVRNDNRLENLELWITRQPYGQRVSDQIEWAKWILETYDE